MRVLLTTDTIGGVWTYTKELTEGLLERFHSVFLVSFGRSPSRDQRAWCSAITDQYADRFSYVASEVSLEWMDGNETAYAGAESLLLELTQSFKADLLHTNQFCFGALPVDIPKLVAAHSDVLSWAARCRPNGLESSPWLDRYRQLVQTGLDSTDAVIAPTHWMLGALAHGFQMRSRKYVIHNGRDVPPVLEPPRRKLQAATIGRLWDEAKGLATLAEVTAPFPILVAGEDRHGSESAPRSLGQANALGRLEDEELLGLLRSSSIYLALSIYEPFGLAPLEAALCGCAIVARDLASLREVWSDAALYFEDARSLSSLLDQLAREPALLERYRLRAMTCARQMSRSHMTERYVDLYRHLLEPEYPFHPAQVGAEVQPRVS